MVFGGCYPEDKHGTGFQYLNPNNGHYRRTGKTNLSLRRR